MTAPDAASASDSDAPPRIAVPWWRHRRRLFYLVTGLLAIALPWGGWHWWYRADFPMPILQLAVTLPPFADWLHDRRETLVRWKEMRETHRLRLAGTAWENTSTGAKITFDRNGFLRVESPSGGPLLLRIYTMGWDYLNIESKAALASLDGARYDFVPEAFPGEKFNLFLPDSPWKGRIVCFYDHRRIQIYLEPKVPYKFSKLEHVSGNLTRLPDP